jgi:4-hydroxybenzoate polyprenyltransferase
LNEEKFYMYGHPFSIAKVKALYCPPVFTMAQLFQIIRLPNLLMAAAIQVLVYFFLLDTTQTILTIADLILLVFSTMFVAAAGYVINDYYDAAIDQVNKPSRWIAGNIWSMEKVLQLFYMLSLLGGILATIVAFRLGLIIYLFIYPLAIACLWFYSYSLKCKPITGNIWVSLFCAGVIMLVALADLLHKRYEAIQIELWYYALFAFLSTWYREIVKDLEDVQGDQRADCKTFPVKYGISKGKIFAGCIAFLLLVALLIWEMSVKDREMRLLFTVMEGSVVASFAFTVYAKDHAYFHKASLMIKGIMLAGTLMLLLI